MRPAPLPRKDRAGLGRFHPLSDATNCWSDFFDLFDDYTDLHLLRDLFTADSSAVELLLPADGFAR